MTKLLSVRDLHVDFATRLGVVPAVSGVSFDLDKGGALGIVGESGSGKSVTALAIMGLVTGTAGARVSGQILFDGEDLITKKESELLEIRGNRISMIFQEPMTALNPVFTVGDQVVESLVLHQGLGRSQARRKAKEMLDLVGIPAPDRRVDDYPHQMSGGMRQRVMIAMALCCNPDMLVADEPTTALDVTIQAQILDLMKKLRKDLGTAIIMITHNLGVVAEMVDEVVVMYAGQVVEHSDVCSLFEDPLHPYTEGLLGSLPKINDDLDRLVAIDGVVPSLARMPKGCRFNPRCRYAEQVCREREPKPVRFAQNREARCWRLEGFGNAIGEPAR